ncbi:MAG: DUF72 domain-containing protein [Acidobacteria bacterium]|nr:MAG: DUF72 domain-containing protein [Acidobacteriota bacterium]
MDSTLTPRTRVGPAGWSYADWNGIVYPAHRPHGFHEASYLAQFFDTIEINTSFYQPLKPELVKNWIRKIEHNPRFKFTAKLWQRFTHDRNANREDEKVFKDGLSPLLSNGRLGALLLQFPWSFKNNAENREYVGGLSMQFIEYPLVLEVRHGSWNRPEVFDMLAELGVGFCNIDQPVIGGSIRPTEHSTSPVGYVRLHGRNYEHWFSSKERSSDGGERYDYLYSLDELEPWVDRIRKVAERVEATYVITNNHFEGKAVANALELSSLLSGHPVQVPESLAAHYPGLEQIAAPSSTGSQPGQTVLLFEPSAASKQ